MVKVRLLSRPVRKLVEQKIALLCPQRMLYYNMKPGYVFPLRNYRVI